jgi:hypothetical protein
MTDDIKDPNRKGPLKDLFQPNPHSPGTKLKPPPPRKKRRSAKPPHDDGWPDWPKPENKDR